MLLVEAPQQRNRISHDGVPTFAMRVLDGGETLVLAMEGEADIACASACFSSLKEAVCEGNHQTVIVDLSGCDFMDSSVVKTLIGVGWMARERKRKFVLSHPSRNLQRIFNHMRMEKFVTVRAV